MKIPFVSKINDLLGLGSARSLPAPEIQLITDGLMVTTSRALGWYVIGTSNTDEASDAAIDAELDAVIRSVSPHLQGREAHLKIVWGRIDGQGYLEELDNPTTWDDARADWLDDFEIASRHLLLGVVIDDERGDAAKSQARQKAAAVLGLPAGHISDRERNWLHGLARELGRALDGTEWSVSLASTELLSWMVSREMHRGAVLPRTGTVTGAGIAQLTGGRIVPYADHLEAVGGDGVTTRHIAVLALSELPEEIETPGDQEWLRTLSQISRTNSDGDLVPVIVDASVRFTVLTSQTAQSSVEKTRQLAKEQRQSAAKHSAEDASTDIEETERTMQEVNLQLSRAGMRLVHAHPRLVVSEPTLEELNDAVTATITHFANIGITAYRALDEQRELWLETLPGDQIRVTDLGHILDGHAFFGAWWWGGAQVGDGPGTRMIGFQTGSTPGIVRYSLTAGARRRQAQTTAYCGVSGLGKTTAMMLSEIDAVSDGNTWLGHLSVKLDDLSLAEAASTHGIPAEVVTFSAENSGCADVFRSLPPEDAISALHGLIELVTPQHLRRAASSPALQAITAEAQDPNPSTHHAIQRLFTHPDPEARELGELLNSHAMSNLGAPVFGPFHGRDALNRSPGLWVIALPGLDVPAAETPQDYWTPIHRLSQAAVRAVTLHMLAVGASPDLRQMSKVIAVPELHRLVRSADGKGFFDQVCRMGSAWGVSVVVDSQDATTYEGMTGLAEQLSALFVFGLRTHGEQDAAARLLGKEISDATRQRIRSLPRTNDPNKIRKGHCLMRDSIDRVAAVQIVIPDRRTEILLNTSQDSEVAREQLREHEQDQSGTDYLDDPYVDPYVDDDIAVSDDSAEHYQLTGERA